MNRTATNEREQKVEWETVYSEDGYVDRMPVPGGWIYRTTDWFEEGGEYRVSRATTVFVPTPRS